MPLFLRFVLALALLSGSSGCSVYNRIFRPHYIPDPPMSPAVKARMKAAEKARKAGLKTAASPKDATTTESATDTAPPDLTVKPEDTAEPLPQSNAKFRRKDGRIKKPRFKHRRYKTRKPRKQKSRDQKGEGFFSK